MAHGSDLSGKLLFSQNRFIDKFSNILNCPPISLAKPWILIGWLLELRTIVWVIGKISIWISELTNVVIFVFVAR